MNGVFKDGDGKVTNPKTSEGGNPGANYVDANGKTWPLLAADLDGFVVTKWKTSAPSDGSYGQFDAAARIGVSLNQSDLVDSIDQFVSQYEGQHGRVNLPADGQPWYEAFGGSPGFAIALVAAWLVWTDSKRRGRR